MIVNAAICYFDMASASKMRYNEINRTEQHKGGVRMKKTYLVIAAIALITCIAGAFPLAAGIAERGWGGVNYGRVVFPLLIGAAALCLYSKKK